MKKVKDKNIPFILETDLLYSSIVGCPNPPISGGPYTSSTHTSSLSWIKKA
ncbi:hypothetical protein [Helicobacter japonicus]|uniref:hypothetical protein n=1 Tax=Helicobacter japonicus TaxID=425400 RepID=UPI0023F26BC4|nr:hypothetical protein [Helicobacter japonicus]